LKIFSFHVKCSESYNVNYFSNHNLKHYVDVAILLSWLVRFELHWGQCLFRWRSVRNRYTESSSWGIEGEQEVHWRFVDCNNHASCRTKQKLPCLPAPIAHYSPLVFSRRIILGSGYEKLSRVWGQRRRENGIPQRQCIRLCLFWNINSKYSVSGLT
jgi:hypothetical protein